MTLFSSPKKKIIQELQRFGQAWSASKIGTYASSTAYYTVFSIAPLLIIAISLASIFLDRSFVEQGITNEFGSAFGQESAGLVTSLIQTRESDQTNVAFAVIGFVTLLLAATGIFSGLQSALDTIFQALPDKAKKTKWTSIRQKLFSMGMVLSLGFVMLASLVTSTLITAFSDYLNRYISQGDIVAHVVEIGVSFLLILLFLTMMYRFLPSKKISLKRALVAGIICALLFSVGKFAIGLYLGSADVIAGYGPAGALVLIILWTYYLTQIFLLSAIIARLYVSTDEGKYFSFLRRS